MAAAASVCSLNQSEMTFFFFSLIYVFERALESVVVIGLLRLKVTRGPPPRSTEQLSEGGLWGPGSRAQLLCCVGP